MSLQDSRLGINQEGSIGAEMAQRYMANASFVALAGALRLFTGKRLGRAVFTAYEADDPSSFETLAPVSQLQISSTGWGVPLNLLKAQPVRGMEPEAVSAAKFARAEDAHWTAPPLGVVA